MKNRLMVHAFLLLILAGGLLAQDQATWVPTEPNPGDSLTLIYDPLNGMAKLPASASLIKLHWGINQTSPGNWRQPPETVWPPDSKAWSDKKAIQSPMTKMGDGTWQITIATLDTFKTVHFVFTDGSAWDNNTSSDWIIWLGGGGSEITHKDWIKLNCLVDLGAAIQNRGFSYGDTVEARAGFFTTAADMVKMRLRRVGNSSSYKGTMDVLTTIGDTLDYSYFAKKNGKDNWEVYYDFEYTGPAQSEAQQRRIPVTSAVVTANDTVRTGNVSPRRAPLFKNQSVIAQPEMTVTLTCDVRPAYYHLKQGGARLKDIQGSLAVGDPDSIFILGLAVNGPITGSWSNDAGPDWGPHLMTLENKKMVDDGTHGDGTAGDSIFAIQFRFYKDSSDVVGQEFKFGIGGGDNEGGFGNNHVENIDDFTADFTIEAQFGSIDPYFYKEWDFDIRQATTGIRTRNPALPSAPTLSQNFPNPFNPSTVIRYALPGAEIVNLSIYNLMGERIAVLAEKQRQNPGSHTVVWNGKDGRGNPVGAGVYLIRLETRGSVQRGKMVLVK